jgi:hypothetical protein
VQAGLARFFAGKMRAGLAYALYQRTKDPQHLDEAVGSYRAARDAFAAVVETTTGVYRPDLTFGDRVAEHGHWADRLPAVEEDLAALVLELETARAAPPADGVSARVPVIPAGDRPALRHTPPAAFRPGAEVVLTAEPDGPFDGTVVLHYRHLNQGEHYRTVELDAGAATVPGDYTDSPYPLVYFFTMRHADGDAWIVPGLDETLANQPYHVVRQGAG